MYLGGQNLCSLHLEGDLQTRHRGRHKPVHRRTLLESIRPKKTPSKSLLDNLTLYKDKPQIRAQAYLTSFDLTVARTFRVRTRDGYGWACRVLTVTRIAAVSRILLLSIRSRESDVRHAKGALFRDAVVLHILETFGDSLDVVAMVIFVAYGLLDTMSVIGSRECGYYRKLALPKLR